MLGLVNRNPPTHRGQLAHTVASSKGKGEALSPSYAQWKRAAWPLSRFCWGWWHLGQASLARAPLRPIWVSFLFNAQQLNEGPLYKQSGEEGASWWPTWSFSSYARPQACDSPLGERPQAEALLSLCCVHPSSSKDLPTVLFLLPSLGGCVYVEGGMDGALPLRQQLWRDPWQEAAFQGSSNGGHPSPQLAPAPRPTVLPSLHRDLAPSPKHEAFPFIYPASRHLLPGRAGEKQQWRAFLWCQNPIPI